MKLCRFTHQDSIPRLGLVREDGMVTDLTGAGLREMTSILESPSGLEQVRKAAGQDLPQFRTDEIRWLSPAEGQEIWAAGVTYLRSKKARMEESDFSATAYDRVYEAARPELFFKSLPEKSVGSGDTVGIRQDARWNVPEPELALVLSSAGQVVGYTIGNDMSSRDIEGENLLYLPQAKVYNRSCALGPWVVLGASEAEARSWSIALVIHRAGKEVFAGSTNVGQIKRSFEELAGYLWRSQTFPRGAILLTGTGVVPADDFTLLAGDRVEISISGIGQLTNSVTEV